MFGGFARLFPAFPTFIFHVSSRKKAETLRWGSTQTQNASDSVTLICWVSSHTSPWARHFPFPPTYSHSCLPHFSLFSTSAAASHFASLTSRSLYPEKKTSHAPFGVQPVSPALNALPSHTPADPSTTPVNSPEKNRTKTQSQIKGGYGVFFLGGGK